MPKKSKWLDVEFAPADFHNPHNVMILIKVLKIVEDAVSINARWGASITA